MLSCDALNIALKDWHCVCRALASGRQVILLRKGGILEAKRGFEIPHSQFLLFPTFLHQNRAMLKPEVHPDLRQMAAEPQTISIKSAGVVSEIVRLQDRRQMDALDAEHIWTDALIDMRFNYKPQNPLYLIIVRAYRLARAATIQNTPAYAGCKSWVPLTEPVDCFGAVAALSDEEFEARRSSVLKLLS